MRLFLASLLLACGSATAAERPNILWLTCEDNNVNWVGCYGNPHAHTPPPTDHHVHLHPHGKK
jgi:uncharacterized sulfatase